MEKLRSYCKKIWDIIKYRLWLLRCWLKDHKKVMALAVAATAVVTGCICWFLLRTYHNYEVVSSIDRNSDTSANYYFRDDGILCYSKDGVSFTNKAGDIVWNQVFGMEAPQMSACGDYIAIGDVGANSLYICNGEGVQAQITLEKPLENLRVSKQGVVAAVLSDSGANQINLYDRQGNVLVSIKASIETTGYPLALALSDDASRMAVSYVVFESGKISSQVVFYNFSNKETSSTPAGSFSYEQLIPRIEFVGGQTVMACGESSFMIYRFKDTVVERVNKVFDGEVKSIFVTEKNIGIIMKNTEAAKDGETVDKYMLEAYSFSGGRSGAFTFDFDYKAVSASDRDIIFYNDQECEIYTYRGHKKFQYVFEHNIESVLPGKKSGEYMLLDAQSLQTIRLK